MFTSRPLKEWWALQGSNLRPAGYEPEALPTELRARSGLMARNPPFRKSRSKPVPLPGSRRRIPVAFRPGRDTRHSVVYGIQPISR